MSKYKNHIILFFLIIFAIVVLSLYIYSFCNNMLTIIVVCGLGLLLEILFELIQKTADKIKKG